MEFDFDSLMQLAEQFDKKAEQLLETAESIRETAEIMTAGQEETPKPEPTTETKPPIEHPTPAPAVTPEPPSPPAIQTTTSVAPSTPDKEDIPKQPELFSPPQIKVPKRINGKTKLAPMEKLILRALENKHLGLHKNKIVSFCRKNGNIGTHNSVTASLVKLKKAGYIICVDRAVYALPNTFNQN